MHKKSENGFTTLELILVIIIIAAMVAIAMLAVIYARRKGTESTTLTAQAVLTIRAVNQSTALLIIPLSTSDVMTKQAYIYAIDTPTDTPTSTPTSTLASTLTQTLKRTPNAIFFPSNTRAPIILPSDTPVSIPPLSCSDYTNPGKCNNNGCYWWNNTCNTAPPPPDCNSLYGTDSKACSNDPQCRWDGKYCVNN